MHVEDEHGKEYERNVASSLGPAWLVWSRLIIDLLLVVFPFEGLVLLLYDLITCILFYFSLNCT